MKHYLDRLQQVVRENWGDKAVCNYRGEEFTFGDIATWAEKFHIAFDIIGVKDGDKIALAAKNSARWAVSMLSINTSGAVTVPILADFTPESMCMLIDHSESVVLFTDEDLWQKMDITRMPLLKAVYCVNDFSLLYTSDESLSEKLSKVEDIFKEKYPAGFGPQDSHFKIGKGSDMALLNYTSGTTSAPKGVMITYDAFSSNVEFADDEIHLGSGDKMVSMLPMAHMYGLMFEFVWPICSRATVYFLGKTPTPSLLLSAMKDVKPSLIITVPLVMEKIFKNAIAPKISTPAMKVLTKIPFVNELIFKKIREALLGAFGGNVREIVMGGAALNPSVEYWFRKISLPYTVGYGMTEFAPLLAYNHPCDFAQGSCGSAVDRIEVRIDSEDPQNVVGEIQARGISQLMGYYKNEEATAAAFTEDGWVKTGDLGVIDAQGHIFIRGRSKNMILSANGQNIYPEEMEAVVNNHEGVVESVVVDRSGKLVALVYLDENYEGDRDALVSAIREDSNKVLPKYSQIAVVEPVKEPFEKTPKMSIRRFLYS